MVIRRLNQIVLSSRYTDHHKQFKTAAVSTWPFIKKFKTHYMGAIKNYLINHPEIMEMQRFDEGYRLAKQEEERYWELYQDELTELNTLLTMDVDNEYKNNYYATQKSNS